MELLNPDAPKVTPDFALELMVHHLQLAHMYFQNIPEDSRKEAERLFNLQYFVLACKDDGGLGEAVLQPYYSNAPEIVAGLLWFDKMEKIYEELKKND